MRPLTLHASHSAESPSHRRVIHVEFAAEELGSREEVGDFLVQHVDGQWNCPWSGKVGAKGWMSVRAAITAVQEGVTLAEILKRSIAFTGDVDTVATIALGAAALSAEIEKDLPAILFEGLEDGEFGRNHILELDRKLIH